MWGFCLNEPYICYIMGIMVKLFFTANSLTALKNKTSKTIETGKDKNSSNKVLHIRQGD